MQANLYDTKSKEMDEEKKCSYSEEMLNNMEVKRTIDLPFK